jgi:hypothetical protein
MNQLKLQVAKARRRLIVQQFLGVLAWCLFGTLLVAAIAIGVQKKWLAGVDGWQWAAAWIGGGALMGLLMATVWTWLARLPELQAAIEIDHRFGLKERVSSSLALSADELETPFGQALVDDAERRVSRLDVDERFPVKLQRRSLLWLIPAAAAFALCFLADPTRPSQNDASANTVALSKQIQESVKPLQKKLEERIQQAGKDGLKDAEDLLKKFEEGTRDLAKKDDGDRREAVGKLNDLAKQLDERRDKLAEGEKLKEQLAGMKNLPSGPADKLAKDLKNGDLGKALKELEKLQEQMAQGKLDPEKQKQLAEQLEAMKDALQKMADNQQKAQEQLQKQLDKAIQAGDKEGAKKLQDQLQKMAQQQAQMNQLKDLGAKLGQAAQSMKDGKIAQAQAALNKMAGDLAQMQQDAAELQMLETTLDEIADAKAAMNCPNCNGQGCELCQNHGGMNFTDHGRQEGAEGERPENPHDTKMYDSKVNQNIGKGSSVITGLVEGPNSKGQAVEEIKGQVEAAKHDAADPLTGQRLPRQQRDHVQQYFDAFRKGQ